MFYRKVKKLSNFVKQNKAFVALFLIFCVAYSLVSILRHNNLSSSAFDLGIYDQKLWKYATFSGFENTITNTANHWSYHFDPTFMLLTPLYWLWDNVKMLLLFQALFLVLGSLPIYLIAQEKIKNKVVSLIISFSYLFFVGLNFANQFDFHPYTLASTFFAFAFWLFLKEKFIWYFLCIILILGLKENLGIAVAFLGLFFTFFSKRRIFGFATFLIGAAWLFIATKLIIPIFGGGYVFFTYSALGKDLSSALLSVIKNPLILFENFFNHFDKIRTFIIFIASFGFLPLLGFEFWIVLFPLFGEKFWSDRYELWQIFFHYNAVIAVFLVLAAIYALARLDKLGAKVLKLATIIMLAGSLTIFVYLDDVDTHPLQYLFSADYWVNRSSEIESINLAIPKVSSVLAQALYVPHLSHRKNIYVVGSEKLTNVSNLISPDYIIVNLEENPWPLSKMELEKFVNDKLTTGQYVRLRSDKILVLTKKE